MNHKVRVQFSTCKQLPVQLVLTVEYSMSESMKSLFSLFQHSNGQNMLQKINWIYALWRHIHDACKSKVVVFFQFQAFVLTDIHALRPSREAFSCHNRKGPPQCDSRHHPGSSDLCFGIIGWLTLFSFAQCWLDAAAPDWYYVSCILWGGMGWQDRKAAGEGLTVNARRIIKTCEWWWIITSQAHLDMHIGGNALGGKNARVSHSRAQLLRFFRVFLSLRAPWRRIGEHETFFFI